MEQESLLFIRAALHDLANILAGVRGIIDLSDPAQPLAPRDRSRLEAVLEEGTMMLERCRHLAMGSFPPSGAEPGADWRAQLAERLAPLSVLFRAQVDLAHQCDPECDQWPGELARDLAQALTRAALAQARGAALDITCAAGPEGWRVTWKPVPKLPEALAEGPGTRAQDIGARWIRACARELEAGLGCSGGTLELRIPRTR